MRWFVIAFFAVGVGALGFNYMRNTGIGPFSNIASGVGADRPTGSRMSSQEHAAGDPSDYFPMKTGTTWTYLIKLGEAEPTKYEEVHWPSGKGGMIMATRGRFLPAMDKKRDQFTLQLRIKGPASRQGGLHYPIGAELDILQDDLGVFFDTAFSSRNSPSRTIFFAVTENDRYEALLVIPHDPDEPGAPSFGGWGRGPDEAGYSLRFFFFGARLGIQLSLGDKPTDHLLFAGSSVVPGSQGRQALHFTRQVDKSDKSPSVDPPSDNSAGSDLLNQGFIEDMWFERGRGLVRLIQRRAGAVTMTWTLAQFSE